MKDKAITYLMQNPLLHMGMIEAIRRNTAEILYAKTDGVLLKEQKSNAYMLSVSTFEKGQNLIDSISNCNGIAVHQEYLVDYTLNKFKLTEKIECFQAVYMSKTKLNIKEELEIKPLEENQIEVVLAHYDTLSPAEIQALLKNKSLFGGYKNGILIGFIGNHLEGSMGILEIFPEYRRLGYGLTLESYLINHMLEKDLVPFAQIEINNEKSLALQNKLGFSISKDKLYWMF